MENDEKENHSKEHSPKGGRNNLLTTHEKAQFAVFANGSIPKEQFAQWVRDDLTAIHSFINTIRREEQIFNMIVESYWGHYQALHKTTKENADATE